MSPSEPHRGEEERTLPPCRRLRHASDFPEARVTDAIARHRRCLAGTGPGRVLKQEPPNTVTLVELADGRSVCVKESGGRGWLHRWKDLLRPAPIRREWRSAHRLAARRVPVARPYALLEAPLRAPRTSGFLILEGLREFERLDSYAARRLPHGVLPRADRLRFLRRVADFLRDLHDRGIHHGDTKAANLLIREHDGGWELRLVDLADVGIGRRVDPRRRLVSLAQLNASVPLAVTATDRLRFLRRYGRGLAAFEPPRRAWGEVLRITRTRKCIWDRDPPGPGA